MNSARRGRRLLRLVAAALLAGLAVGAAAPAAAQEWAYAVERGNVYRVNLFSHASEVVATTDQPGLALEHLALAEDGWLYGLCRCPESTLYRVDPVTGATAALAAIPAGVLPEGLASDGAGGLWLVDRFRRLFTLDRATGAVLGELPIIVDGDFLGSAGGRDGELFALTWSGDSVHPAVVRIDPATGVGTTVVQVPADDEPVVAPFSFTVDHRGRFWVSDARGEIILGLNCYEMIVIDPVAASSESVWSGCIFVPATPALMSIAVLDPFGAVEIPAAGPLGLALLALALAAVALRRLAGR